MIQGTPFSQGWETGNIRLFAQMKSGHTPSRSVPEYWQDTDIPWFTLADVWQLRDGRQTYLGETATTINELGLANSSAELLPKGTVVLSRTASVGFSGVMPKAMATSQDFWNWICGPKLLPEYLNYQFKSMTAVFKSLNMGSTHQTIYQKDAAALQIVVPPIGEQRAIVDYLDRESARVDTLIEEQLRLIGVLSERRRATIELVIADIEGDRADLRYFARLVSGSGFPVEAQGQSGLEFPFFKVKDLKTADSSGVLLTAKDTISRETAQSLRASIIPAGSLIFAKVGAALMLGRVAALPVDGCVDNNLSALIFDTTFDRSFARYLMLTFDFQRFVQPGAVPSLNMDGLREFRVPRVPVSRQRDVAANLDAQIGKIDKLIAETERFVELARERRTALIAAAVTGQIDVRKAA